MGENLGEEKWEMEVISRPECGTGSWECRPYRLSLQMSSLTVGGSQWNLYKQGHISGHLREREAG